ncbi:MAG: nitroreductase family protein [Desulfatibacillaceae bacterium]
MAAETGTAKKATRNATKARSTEGKAGAGAKTAPKAKEEPMSPIGVYEPGMPHNPVEKVILERRSIRYFKKDPLPDDMIRRVLEAGRFAPSAGNCQPWKFVVVNSREIIRELEADAKKMAKILMFALDYSRGPVRKRLLKPFSQTMIRLMQNELHPVPFSLLQRIAQDEAPVFHGAPTLILLLEDTRGVACPPMDIGICGQNMVLAAHSLGAGTCWLGMIKLCMYYPKWRKRFGVKYPYRCTDCIALGWPAGDHDGMVPREVQYVQWFDRGPDDPPRIERQGV